MCSFFAITTSKSVSQHCLQIRIILQFLRISWDLDKLSPEVEYLQLIE
jgi:hypothetical protein